MPLHIASTRTLRLPLPADTAFLLFTPKGEEAWIPEWRPRYIRPADGRTGPGMVFTTGEGEDFTIWQVLAFDRAARRSLYARTTPAARAGTVGVQVAPLGPDEAEVQVRYELTALTPPAGQGLAQYEGEAFARMIDGWGAAIVQRLPALASDPLLRQA
jgi:hypothetical protein